ANRIPDGNPVDQEVDWQPLTSAMPKTKIVRASVNGRRHIARFAFAATGPATGYRCALRAGKRRARFRRCSSPQTYRHLKPGRYTFEVKAFGPGEPYHTVGKRRFKMGRPHHHR
ncbi:MAG TPA: hypothetical protein VE197_12845, partial [Mycobacterium sp.]|nr:hypothetical protein [Mycobacterium sp.]